MAPRSFSIRQCEDAENQASMRAAFVSENPLQRAYRLCRRARDDRDDEDARESDESVRCVDGIPQDWSDRSSERRDIRFWRDVHAEQMRSFVVGGLDVVRFFLRLRPPPRATFQPPAPDKSSPPCGPRIAWMIGDGLRRFWPP